MEVLEQADPDFRAIYDLFAGPGGWEVALELLGVDPRFMLGLEWSPIASTTARLAGYARLVADVSKLDVKAITEKLRGQIGSAPCQTFSPAGGSPGLEFLPLLVWAIHEIGAGRDPFAHVKAATGDTRSVLVLEPLRWALHLRPTWIAWEQSNTVQPIWDAAAVVLRAAGYSVATGVLDAEQYDVPQAKRRRAVLLGSLERSVALPPPVRSRYHPTDPGRLDPGLEPWLSMADALPHRAGLHVVLNYGTGGNARKRGVRTWKQPAFTVTSKFARNKWSDGSRITVAEASALQTFPAAHPWYGDKVDFVSQQIGDAVPPMLAAHCLAALGVGDLARARAAAVVSLGAAA